MLQQKIVRYKKHDIRILYNNEVVLFVGKDVCGALGIVNCRDSVKRTREDGRSKEWVHTSQGDRMMWVFNETGLRDFMSITKKNLQQAIELYNVLLDQKTRAS